MPQWECHLSPLCCPGIGTVYLIGCGQSSRALYIKMEEELHKWRWKEFWWTRLLGKKKSAFFGIISGLEPGSGTQNNRLKITCSKFVFSSSQKIHHYAIEPTHLTQNHCKCIINFLKYEGINKAKRKQEDEMWASKAFYNRSEQCALSRGVAHGFFVDD